MENLPVADAWSDESVDSVRAIVEQRGLVGAANNTKWNELLAHIRQFKDWRPSYRSKWVNGFISDWDVEWRYHLPFPFVGVEWLDIGLHQQVSSGRLLPPRIIDHSPEVLPHLGRIGLEFEVRGDVVQIWGYLPKSYEDFPPDAD